MMIVVAQQENNDFCISTLSTAVWKLRTAQSIKSPFTGCPEENLNLLHVVSSYHSIETKRKMGVCLYVLCVAGLMNENKIQHRSKFLITPRPSFSALQSPARRISIHLQSAQSA